MDLEIIEIVKEYRCVINHGTLGIAIKARVVKHADAKDHTHWYQTNLAYKEVGNIEPYRPGATASSFEQAQSKLFTYLQDFQKVISKGGDVEANTYID